MERQIKQAQEKGNTGDEKLTELGNARRLVRQHGQDLRFVPAWRNWLVWEDGNWRRDEDGGIMRLAKATAEAMIEEAVGINDPDKRSALLRHALASQKATQLQNMVTLAESEAEVVLAASKLDCDPWLLGVSNGVIDLRSRTFREARREDNITKIAGVHFDERALCPNWRAFLSEF